LTGLERRGHVSLALVVVQLLQDESAVADHDDEGKNKTAVDGDQSEACTNLQRRAKSLLKKARSSS